MSHLLIYQEKVSNKGLYLHVQVQLSFDIAIVFGQHFRFCARASGERGCFSSLLPVGFNYAFQLARCIASTSAHRCFQCLHINEP